MRIVRFIELWQAPMADVWMDPQWGLLVDELIYPLEEAPYLSERINGVWAPVIEPDATALPLSECKLLAPVMPRKIICVGRNYAEHAAETGSDVPAEPLIFLKATTALLDPGEPVVYPTISQRVDHEGELAVVIGERCRFVSEEDAPSVIFAYTVANDVTARDLQTRDGQWARAKSFDTFAPIGPWLDTTFDPTNRIVRCLVNGQVRQESSTDKLIFSVNRIISYISQAMTLEPGDVILTGTPAGISAVQPGDVMTVEVEGLGSFSNPVISQEEANRRATEAAANKPGDEETPF